MDFAKAAELLRNGLPSLMAAYVHGSWGRGDAGVDSDLDLAVLVDGRANPLALWDLSHRIGDEAGCSVDLVDLRGASIDLIAEVLCQGQLLWSRGLEVDLWESAMLSEKLRFDEKRHDWRAEILTRKSVYGL